MWCGIDPDHVGLIKFDPLVERKTVHEAQSNQIANVDIYRARGATRD